VHQHEESVGNVLDGAKPSPGRHHCARRKSSRASRRGAETATGCQPCRPDCPSGVFVPGAPSKLL
jgi:hypothetical protein